MLLVHALALLAGASTIQIWPQLPGTALLLALAIAAIALSIPRVSRVLGLFLLAAALAGVAANHRLASPLPAELSAADLQVRGTVVGLPEADGRLLRFRLRVEAAELDGRAVEIPHTLRLTWFGPPSAGLNPGERWQLPVQIRQPSGLANPGGFDYPRWLFHEGIGATGHVRSGEGGAYRLEPAGLGLDPARDRLRQAILKHEGLRHHGTLTALAIGDRGPIDDAAWDVLIATGTNHLVAISGLHVGLAALTGFVLGRLLWRTLPGALRGRLPRPVCAAITGLLLAAAYAALAGFAIPTQRALIMLGAGLGTLILRRRATPSDVVAVALVGVLAFDPLAPMAPGFWLSFGAVSAILWVVCARVGPPGWRLADLARLQIAIAVALAPLVLLLFARTSVAGPIANLVAVPWVSVLVVPPTLAGTLLSPWLPLIGGWLLQLADWAFVPLWWLLEWLAGHPWAELHRPAPGPLALALGVVGVVILLAPRGVPGKAAGLVCLLPMVAVPMPEPAPGDVYIDVLDAGEGVSVVVRTGEYSLVFDSGGLMSSRLDGATAVVIPFLRATGIGQPDDLLLSQGHRRHMGGSESLIAALPPQRVIASPAVVDDPPRGVTAKACRAGERWVRDGVTFTLIHPRPHDPERLAAADLACVLRIDAPGGSALIAPGLGHRAQWFMLTRDITLAADVLVRSARGPDVDEFRAAIAPRWVIHTGGSLRGTSTWPPPLAAARAAGHARTDCGGAVHLVIEAEEGVQRPQAWREQKRRFWQTGCGGPEKSGTMRAVVPVNSR